MKARNTLTAALTLLCAVAQGQAQTLSDAIQKSQCALPVYFPVETFYAGSIQVDHNRIKVQVHDLGSIAARAEFMTKNRAGKANALSKADIIHEFSTTGEADFGSLPSDVYKGIEKSGNRYMFKVRGVGEALAGVQVLYRRVPAHGQVVIDEVSVVEYFRRILKDHILPAIQRCPK